MFHQHMASSLQQVVVPSSLAGFVKNQRGQVASSCQRRDVADGALWATISYDAQLDVYPLYLITIQPGYNLIYLVSLKISFDFI